jgi:RHS repeat-associated protein
MLVISLGSPVFADSAFTLTVTKGGGTPLEGVNTYVFTDTGSYTGMNGQTNANGEVAFTLADGLFKFRVDTMGYQYWTPVQTLPDTLAYTFEILHQDVTVTVENTFQGATEAMEGIPTYLFTAGGSYQGISVQTDANGHAVYNVPPGSFKVRADWLSKQVFSTDFDQEDRTITFEQGRADITFTQGGSNPEGVSTYVFTASGTYLGISAQTGTGGMVSFTLPTGAYKFRCDYQGSEFWSEETTLLQDTATAVLVDADGGDFVLTVTKGAATPLVGVNVYVFSDTGSYLGMSGQTDGNGEVSFSLSGNGESYKFRVDTMGYQYWTPVQTLPDTLAYTFEILHQDVTVTLEKTFQGATEAMEGIATYLFTAGGSYQGISVQTDANGHAVYNVPPGSFKVRADWLTKQVFSTDFDQEDRTITFEQGRADITFTQGGSGQEGVSTYIFTASGTYLGISGQTGTGGMVSFTLPTGAYKFRCDYQGSEFWSEETTLLQDTATAVLVDADGGDFVLTVTKGAATPLVGVNVYVFSDTGSYLGISDQTDGNGEVSFSLSGNGESYKFRVDTMGYQYWTPVQTLPDTLAYTFEILHQDVTVTVEKTFQGATEAMEGISTYLFTAGGSYQGISFQTDASGHAVYNVPPGSFKVRADWLSKQVFSTDFDQEDRTITFEQGRADVRVLDESGEIAGVTVYVFSESGAYLGLSGLTSPASFILSTNTYMFRADHEGEQHWSELVTLVQDQVTDVVINTVPPSTGPYVIDLEPANGSVDIDVETKISFKIIDDSDDVDLSTLKLKVGSINYSPQRQSYNGEILGTSAYHGGGTPQGWSGMDKTWAYQLPFPFPFFGKHYRDVYISSNGFIDFGSLDSGVHPNEGTMEFFTRICPCWHNIILQELYITEETDYVVFRWDASVEIEEYMSSIRFECELNKDGTITFHYGECPSEIREDVIVGISNFEDADSTTRGDFFFSESHFFTPQLNTTPIPSIVIHPEIREFWFEKLTDNPKSYAVEVSVLLTEGQNTTITIEASDSAPEPNAMFPLETSFETKPDTIPPGIFFIETDVIEEGGEFRTRLVLDMRERFQIVGDPLSCAVIIDDMGEPMPLLGVEIRGRFLILDTQTLEEGMMHMIYLGSSYFVDEHGNSASDDLNWSSQTEGGPNDYYIYGYGSGGGPVCFDGDEDPPEEGMLWHDSTNNTTPLSVSFYPPSPNLQVWNSGCIRIIQEARNPNVYFPVPGRIYLTVVPTSAQEFSLDNALCEVALSGIENTDIELTYTSWGTTLPVRFKSKTVDLEVLVPPDVGEDVTKEDEIGFFKVASGDYIETHKILVIDSALVHIPRAPIDFNPHPFTSSDLLRWFSKNNTNDIGEWVSESPLYPDRYEIPDHLWTEEADGRFDFKPNWTSRDQCRNPVLASGETNSHGLRTRMYLSFPYYRYPEDSLSQDEKAMYETYSLVTNGGGAGNELSLETVNPVFPWRPKFLSFVRADKFYLYGWGHLSCNSEGPEHVRHWVYVHSLSHPTYDLSHYAMAIRLQWERPMGVPVGYFIDPVFESYTLEGSTYTVPILNPFIDRYKWGWHTMGLAHIYRAGVYNSFAGKFLHLSSGLPYSITERYYFDTDPKHENMKWAAVKTDSDKYVYSTSYRPNQKFPGFYNTLIENCEFVETNYGDSPLFNDGKSYELKNTKYRLHYNSLYKMPKVWAFHTNQWASPKYLLFPYCWESSPTLEVDPYIIFDEQGLPELRNRTVPIDGPTGESDFPFHLFPGGKYMLSISLPENQNTPVFVDVVGRFWMNQNGLGLVYTDSEKLVERRLHIDSRVGTENDMNLQVDQSRGCVTDEKGCWIFNPLTQAMFMSVLTPRTGFPKINPDGTPKGTTYAIGYLLGRDVLWSVSVKGIESKALDATRCKRIINEGNLWDGLNPAWRKRLGKKEYIYNWVEDNRESPYEEKLVEFSEMFVKQLNPEHLIIVGAPVIWKVDVRNFGPAQGPHIRKIEPEIASAGETVTVMGRGFSESAHVIADNGVALSSTRLSSTEMQFTVPSDEDFPTTRIHVLQTWTHDIEAYPEVSNSKNIKIRPTLVAVTEYFNPDDPEHLYLRFELKNFSGVGNAFFENNYGDEGFIDQLELSRIMDNGQVYWIARLPEGVMGRYFTMWIRDGDELESNLKHKWIWPAPENGQGIFTYNTKPVNTGTETVGIGVSTATGAFTVQEVDLTLPGGDVPFQFTRFYSSRAPRGGILGNKWDFNYNQRLEKGPAIIEGETQDVLKYSCGYGRVDYFLIDGDTYTAFPGFVDRLVVEGSGEVKKYSIVKKDGTITEFNYDGSLESITSRRGHKLEFFYREDGKLLKAVDHFDREFVFTYTGDGFVNFITDTTNSRLVIFDYNDDGQLVRVTGPAGRTVNYKYAPDNEDPKANTLINVRNGRNELVVNNDYDQYCRVTVQRSIHGTAAIVYSSGLEAPDRFWELEYIDAEDNLKALRINEHRLCSKRVEADSEWTYEYDGMGNLKQTVMPEGNSVEYDYDTRGNLIQLRKKNIDASVVLSWIYTYEPFFNQILSATDAKGNITTNIYDYQEEYGSGLGARLKLTQDEVDVLLNAITTGLGNKNGDSVTNQDFGNLICVIHPICTRADGSDPPETGAETLMVYNSSTGLLVSEKSEKGLETTYEHETVGFYVKKSTLAPTDSGTPVTLIDRVFNGLGCVTSETDARGNTSTFLYNAARQLISETTNNGLYNIIYAYEETGRLYEKHIKNVDFQGNAVSNPSHFVVRYKYDVLGKTRKEYRGASNLAESSWLCTEYLYNDCGQIETVVFPEGNKVRFEYDLQGRKIREMRGYDSTVSATTTFGYDLNGNLTSEEDPRGNSTTSEFDEFDRLIRVIDPLGNKTVLTYDGMDNVLVSERFNSLNQTTAKTTSEYDERGRLCKAVVSVYDETPTFLEDIETKYLYDVDSRLTKVISPKGHEETLIYNGFRRVGKVTYPDGSWVETTYDDAFNVLIRQESAYNEVTTQKEFFSVSYIYDALNRVEEERPAGLHEYANVLRYDSRSNLCSMTDANGNETRTVYDVFGRPIEVLSNLEGPSGVPNPVLETVRTMTYDGNGRLLTMKNANQFTTSYQYDEQNRPKRIDYADLTYKTVTYDTAGNIHEVRDRMGREIVHEYDELDRLTRKYVKTGTGEDGSQSTFEYDSLGRITKSARNHRGQHTVEVGYRYDSLGRQVFEEQKILATNHAAQVTRLFVSTTLASMTYPSGLYQSYTYDDSDRVRDIEIDLAVFARHKYLGRSRLARRSMMNGVNEISQSNAYYDGKGRTIGFINRQVPTGHIQSWLEYGYDNAGRRLFRKEAYAPDCFADVYSYDAVNRLVCAKNGVVTTATSGQISRTNLPQAPSYDDATPTRNTRIWDLDRQGSRKVVTTAPASGGPATDQFFNDVGEEGYLYGPDSLDRYTKVDSWAYVYDAAGNLIDDQTYIYEWDYENRLMSVTKKSDITVAWFKYDAFGRRIERVTSDGTTTTTTRYVYDGTNVIEERDENNTVQARYIYGPGMDDVLAMERGGVRRYLVRDAHGNVVALTDASGIVKERYRYDAYGNATFLSDVGVVKTITKSEFGNPLLFQARNFDPETGLYYFRARYYSPKLGRFLSPDPKGFSDSTNPYQYCLQNPVNLVDPDGEIIPLLIAGALIIGPALVAEATQSDAVAAWSPAHNIVRTIKGEEVFSGEKLSDLDRVLAGLDVVLSLVPGASKLVTKPLGWALKGTGAGVGVVAYGTYRIGRGGGAAAGRIGRGLAGVGRRGRRFLGRGRDAGRIAFQGGAQPFVDDLAQVTGKTASARNRAIQTLIAKDYPLLRLTHTPKYSPFARTGVAKRGVGTQIGKLRFSDRAGLRRVILHEELHHRWWGRGILTHEHHSDKFYRTIKRYFRMRDWRLTGGGG